MSVETMLPPAPAAMVCALAAPLATGPLGGALGSEDTYTSLAGWALPLASLLEFADGDENFARVPPSCFVQEPVLGALFAPAESAPYKGGHYEWPMKQGVGTIDFRIANLTFYARSLLVV
mgnify:CR=1 FL=1